MKLQSQLYFAVLWSTNYLRCIDTVQFSWIFLDFDENITVIHHNGSQLYFQKQWCSPRNSRCVFTIIFYKYKFEVSSLHFLGLQNGGFISTLNPQYLSFFGSEGQKMLSVFFFKAHIGLVYNFCGIHFFLSSKSNLVDMVPNQILLIWFHRFDSSQFHWVMSQYRGMNFPLQQA